MIGNDSTVSPLAVISGPKAHHGFGAIGTKQFEVRFTFELTNDQMQIVGFQIVRALITSDRRVRIKLLQVLLRSLCLPFASIQEPVNLFVQIGRQRFIILLDMSCVQSQYGIAVRDSVIFDHNARGECVFGSAILRQQPL